MNTRTEKDQLKYDPATHFGFGDNWQTFSQLITEAKIDQAVADMKRLLGTEDLARQSFVDVGCGSGLHSLVALRLSATSVTGFDMDLESVETARQVLSKYAPDRDWQVEKRNVFETFDDDQRKYDVVYSWGVLHHTGAMWQGIEKTMALVADGGRFAIAIYRKTPCCNGWRRFKRVYAGLPAGLQIFLRWPYIFLFCLALLATGRNPFAYIRNYENNRGMDYFTDVHDWLGGFPYESASPDELKMFFEARGYETVSEFTKPTRLWGVFGTGCNEFLFRRVGSSPS
jgi:2-polyprenyl-6-hydroxyphenyl methylase/3-demethylubiquinone-9 3-methyltransferase